MLVLTQTFLAKIFAQLIDHAVAGPFSGALDGVYIGLYIAPTVVIGPQSVMAGITEATYDGYARQPITWHPPYVDGVSQETLQSQAAFFNPTDAVVANMVTGWFLADALVAGNLLGGEAFPSPGIGMGSPGNAFSLAVLFQLDARGPYGSGVRIQ